jgi:hypothetical protein
MKPTRDQVFKELKQIKMEIAELRNCAVRQSLLKPVKLELERMATDLCETHNIEWNDFLNISLEAV